MYGPRSHQWDAWQTIDSSTGSASNHPIRYHSPADEWREFRRAMQSGLPDQALRFGFGRWPWVALTAHRRNPRAPRCRQNRTPGGRGRGRARAPPGFAVNVSMPKLDAVIRTNRQ